LDLVLDQGQPLVLELNARPTATLELYEERLPAGGFMSHWLACEGELPTVVETDTIRATAIVYSIEDTTIGAVEWPHWATDRPPESSKIRASEPLCSVHVATRDRAAVTGLLSVRRADIRARINQSARDAA
jgi:predicted ATP-grasp superfamily ATP-dependent carboligase